MSFYFDYSATTPIKKEVLDAMMPWLTINFGNPSSHYALGREARKAVDDSREIIANAIGAKPDEIFFTSGGSEANSWGVRGFIKNYDCMVNGNCIVSPIEHHSVLNAAKGADFMDVDFFGLINVDALKNKIKDSDYYLAAAMMVNNEIGTIEPITEIAEVCEDQGILLHVDAVQAFGHIPFRVKEMKGISTLSMSGHKIGAPKGIGALYIRKDVQELYRPIVFGGQQEQGMRGGTENVASIVGFAKAAELAKEDMKNYSKLKSFCIYANEFLTTNLEDVYINGLPAMDKRRIANNLNVSIKGINGEELVTLLDEQGICISTGSACDSESAEPSHVLKAIGHSDERANSSIRIGFGNDVKLMEINFLCQRIVDGAKLLRD